jgi:hypothetical protein
MPGHEQMTIKQLSTNLEIGFLNILIDLLSDSCLFQSLIRWIYQIAIPRLVEIQDSFEIKFALRWSLAGLVSGALIGFILNRF